MLPVWTSLYGCLGSRASVAKRDSRDSGILHRFGLWNNWNAKNNLLLYSLSSFFVFRIIYLPLLTIKQILGRAVFYKSWDFQGIGILFSSFNVFEFIIRQLIEMWTVTTINVHVGDRFAGRDILSMIMMSRFKSQFHEECLHIFKVYTGSAYLSRSPKVQNTSWTNKYALKELLAVSM